MLPAPFNIIFYLTDPGNFHKVTRNTIFSYFYGPCHAKRPLKASVVVISKEGLYAFFALKCPGNEFNLFSAWACLFQCNFSPYISLSDFWSDRGEAICLSVALEILLKNVHRAMLLQINPYAVLARKYSCSLEHACFFINFQIGP